MESLSGDNLPLFVQCHAASYGDNVKLIQEAHQKSGRVDHAIANAELVECPGWFDKGMSILDVETEPSTESRAVCVSGGETWGVGVDAQFKAAYAGSVWFEC